MALLAEAAEQHANLRALEQRLAQRYDLGLLELDLAGLLERFSAEHTGWSRVLRPQYHRDMAALRAQARPGVSPTPGLRPATCAWRWRCARRAPKRWPARPRWPSSWPRSTTPMRPTGRQ